MSAEYEDEIVGFMVYELFKYNVEIRDFAVNPEFRRQGVGSKMLDKLKGKLRYHGRHLLRVNVSEENLPAQLFFKSQELESVGILPNFFEDYYTQDLLDAYAMVHIPTFE